MTKRGERGPEDWADAAEARTLPAFLRAAPGAGWTASALRAAAREAGLAPGEADLLFPNGPSDLAALFHRDCRAAALAAAGDPSGLKIRARILKAVEAWIDALDRSGPALRPLAGFLALPNHAPLAARLTWAAADAIWRWAGDAATDENHYSKRAILSGVLAGAFALLVTAGPGEAKRFAAARIDDVMRFEAAKARFQPPPIGRALANWLGQLRYGAFG